MNFIIVRSLVAYGFYAMHACRRYCHIEHTCALLSCKWVRQVVAVPSLLTQVDDYISKQSRNIDKLDIMLVEIGPNDVRPIVPCSFSACAVVAVS